MPAKNDTSKAIDPGLAILEILLRVHGVDTDAEQIRNRYGTKPVRIREMLRCAKELGLKARAPTTKWERLANTPLLGIASLRDGGFLILGRVVADEVAVFHPSSPKPKLMTRSEFEAIWDGRLVLMARRVSWLELARRYFPLFIGTGTRTRRSAQRALGADEGVVAYPAKAAEPDHKKDDDSGLSALVILLRCQGIGAEAEQIRHRCGTASIGVTEMLRCAKELGLKARAPKTKWERLANTPLPGIAALRDGGFIILGKVADDQVLVQRPSSPRPEAMTRAEFEAIWGGRLVLMARRVSWLELARRYFPLFIGTGTRTRRSAQRALGADEGGVAYPAKAAEPDHKKDDDSGLSALVTLLRCHGIGAEAEQIRHRCGTASIGVNEMLRCAKELGLKARAPKTKWERLANTPLPGIAVLRDGGFITLGKVADDQVLVQRPSSPRPEAMTRAEFEAIWDGRLVLMARRVSWLELGRRYFPLFIGIGTRTRRLAQRALGADEGGVEYPAEAAEPDHTKADDSGLSALVILLRCQGIGAEAEQIRHRCGTASIGVTEMLRCAKELGLKARAPKTKWERLANTPLPGIAALRDGGFIILGKVADDQVLVQRPSSPRPEAMTRAEFEAIWDGRVVLMARRASLTELSRRFDITWFLGAIHKYRHLLTEVLVASFFLQLFALVSPLFFQVVIDKVLVHRSMSTLDVLIIGLVAIAMFEAILGTLRTYLFAHTTNRIDVELGARLFRHLMALPIAYFQARRVGDSVARVRELENIRQFLTSSALTLVIDLFFTFVFLVVMFYYSPLLTFVVLGAFPIYIAISAGATPLFRQRLDEKFRRGAENQGFLVESVTGVETLKAMAVEPQMQRRWEEQLAGYVAASFRVISLNNTASQAVQLVNKVVIAAILYFGAKLVIEGSLTVGELVAFNMLAARVSMPVLRLAQMWQDFHQARLSVARLGDILNTMPEPSFSPGRAALPAIRGQVSFEHVTFRYRIDASEVLHDVSFSVNLGQVVGIVGSSGSGKSTLAKLIQRLYVPESGRVLVDGVDLTMVDLAWLRRQIGVVLQENVLFNCSVRDNIALADPTMSMERVIAAANLAGAHDFILELPEGYDTIIGERGSSLSGGQRQRIAIARALIADPRILILDEATSSLDYESERAIQQNMKEIAAGRTVFTIAHRLSTVRHADRIITIERGRIIEDGNHDELIRSNGRYAKLHYLQAGIHDIR